LLCPSWRWMTISGTPSRAISTAWACRSWCGAKRRRTPAAAAVRRSSARAAACDRWRPHAVPLMTHKSGPTRSSGRRSSHGCSCSQPHASMPTSRRRPPLPPDQERPAAVIDVAFGASERFLNAKPGSPQDRDQSADAAAMRSVAGGVHDGDDLFDVDRRDRTAARTNPSSGSQNEPDYPGRRMHGQRGPAARYRFPHGAALTAAPRALSPLPQSIS
jgi:hypothetical protein